MSGPFDSEEGSSWKIVHDFRHEAPQLLEDIQVQQEWPRSFLHFLHGESSLGRRNSVSGNAIIIKNTAPRSWSGRLYNVGLHKDDDLIVLKKKLRVGNYAEFLLGNELLFGVVEKGVHHGAQFSFEKVSGNLTPVNLANFPNGVIVTLTQKTGSGEYEYTATEGSSS